MSYEPTCHVSHARVQVGVDVDALEGRHVFLLLLDVKDSRDERRRKEELATQVRHGMRVPYTCRTEVAYGTAAAHGSAY